MQPKYKQIAAQLTEQIAVRGADGILKLPTEAELAAQYHVSRQTIRSALSLLSAQKLITTRQGSGSYSTGLSADPARNVVVLMISSDQEYIYPELIRDIRTTLSSHGFSLKLSITHNRHSAEREYLEAMLADPPRGVIAEGCKSALPSPNLDLYEQLHRSGIPLIFLHGCPALPWAVCVKDDNFYGGYLLGQHLYSQGHTQIAGLFKMDDIQGIERCQGFVTHMRNVGHMVPDECIGWFITADQDALEQRQDTLFLSEFIQKQLGACSALICYNDEIAYWMIKELHYAGLRVPQDVTVVCFDNSYLSELSRTRITSLTHRPHEMGQCAAEYILQAMRGTAVTSREIPWELVTRESDAPPESPEP